MGMFDGEFKDHYHSHILPVLDFDGNTTDHLLTEAIRLLWGIGRELTKGQAAEAKPDKVTGQEYVYDQCAVGWAVGFYDPSGEWHAEDLCNTAEEAARRVRWLNGGKLEEPQRGDPLSRKIGNLELRRASVRPDTFAAEIVKWEPWDDHPMDMTIAYWVTTPMPASDPRYDLQFAGNAPFDKDVAQADFWTLARQGQAALDGFTPASSEDPEPDFTSWHGLKEWLAWKDRQADDK